MDSMNAQVWIQIWCFVIAMILILAGILFNRQDVKELGAKIDRIQSDLAGKIHRVQADLAQFYRILGQHGARLDNLEKRQ